jgi:hypothetical protein
MMTKSTPTQLALAICLAFAAVPSFAQTNDELLKELKALRARVDELEKKLQAVPAAPADGTQPQWGMTPEQVADFNKLLVKTEGLEDSIETNGFKDLQFSGFMDPVFIYNRNQRRAGFQFLNAVPSGGYAYDNGYFGTLALDIKKELEGGTKLHVTLMPNRGAGSIAGADASLVHEASMSIPLGDLQTRFIAGQIPDWSGYEYTQPTTTKLVTRGLLLDYTEPTAYTGAGVELIRGKWDVKAVLANFNKTQQSANRLSPVLAYRADYSKGEFSGFGFAGVEGRVTNFNTGNDTWLDLFEVDGYFVRGDMTLQGQIGFGHQKGAAILPKADGVSNQDAQWIGLSGLAAYKLEPRLEAVVRADYIKNDKNGGGLLGYTGYYDGAGTNGDYLSGIGASSSCDVTDPTTNCKGANRAALAMGFNYALTTNATLKAEYRFDWASQPVFFDTHNGTFKKNNHLLGASVVLSF